MHIEQAYTITFEEGLYTIMLAIHCYWESENY